MRVVLVVALVAGAGAVAWLLFRRPSASGDPSRTARAAHYRQRIIELVKDGDVADRLAEGERRRDPTADMATCYERAFRKLEKDRRR